MSQSAERKRAWRAERKAKGLCKLCTNPRREGFGTCRSCGFAEARRAKKYRDSHPRKP